MLANYAGHCSQSIGHETAHSSTPSCVCESVGLPRHAGSATVIVLSVYII
jgi:hypothetical protein